MLIFYHLLLETYHQHSIGALAVANLANGLDSHIKVARADKPAEKAEFLNVELDFDGRVIYGELTILDYLANARNEGQSAKKEHIFTQGQVASLHFDHWLHVLNSQLRPAVTQLINKEGEPQEVIKAVAKDFEESGLMQALVEDPRWLVLAALSYSYLEPASKLVNKKIQTFLGQLKTKYHFVGYDAFTKA